MSAARPAAQMLLCLLHCLWNMSCYPWPIQTEFSEYCFECSVPGSFPLIYLTANSCTSSFAFTIGLVLIHIWFISYPKSISGVSQLFGRWYLSSISGLQWYVLLLYNLLPNGVNACIITNTDFIIVFCLSLSLTYTHSSLQPTSLQMVFASQGGLIWVCFQWGAVRLKCIAVT